MSKNSFTISQMRDLRKNPYVESVTERRITYSDEFKKKFVEEYRAGKNPRQIFKDAGFDVNALGHKRIERASDRWRNNNNEGLFSDNPDYVEVHKARKRKGTSLISQLSNQAEIIGQLELENMELRKQLAEMTQGRSGH